MLIPTRCPIDGSNDADDEVYPASLDLASLDTALFSARRVPDRVHYRMVRNRRTGCLRADPILDPATLARLYEGSRVTDGSAAEDASRTYARLLPAALARVPDMRGALEVGCGDGRFLRVLLEAGFARVAGVEPSAEAVERADAELAGTGCELARGGLRRALFPPGGFSLVCGFQVLDHLAEPNEALEACRELLVPGGAMLWVCHNVRSLPARLLGRRCPMIDIQHPVLYDHRTVRALFERNGFVVDSVFPVTDRYPIRYWWRLAPLPRSLKEPVARLLERGWPGGVRVPARLGNMGILARRGDGVS